MTQQTNVPERPYLTAWRVQELQHVIIPKALLRAAPLLDLTADDVLLYSILRARCDLSYQNEWLDADGRIYIIFTHSQAAEIMGWSRNTAIASFRRLIEAGLIIEKRQKSENNMDKPSHVYVKQWNVPAEDGAGGFVMRGYTPEVIRAGGLPFLNANNIADRYTGYFSVPRLLIESPAFRDISIKAKLLYVLALDELHKAIRFGKQDDRGLPYCFLHREDVILQLQCSDRTVTKLYAELKGAGLLETKKVGLSANERVYLRDFAVQIRGTGASAVASYVDEPKPENPHKEPTPQNLNTESANSEHRARNNCTPSPQDADTRAAENAQPSRSNSTAAPQDLNTSHRSLVNEVSDLSGVSISRVAREDAPDAIQQSILDQITAKYRPEAIKDDLMLLMGNTGLYRNSLVILDLCLKTIAWAEAALGTELRIGENCYETGYVRMQYRRISPDVLITTVRKIAERFPSIQNRQGYIRQALLTATDDHEGESYYLRQEIEEKRHEAKQ